MPSGFSVASVKAAPIDADDGVTKLPEAFCNDATFRPLKDA